MKRLQESEAKLHSRSEKRSPPCGSSLSYAMYSTKACARDQKSRGFSRKIFFYIEPIVSFAESGAAMLPD
jgi:hypothetical protein